MKIILNLLFILAISVTLIYGLSRLDSDINSKPFAFTRSFLSLSGSRVFTLNDSVRNLAGATTSTIYLESEKIGKIISVDFTFHSRMEIDIPIPAALSKAIGNQFYTEADSPWIYIYAYNLPAIVQYNIKDETTRIRIKPGTAFSHVMTENPEKFYFRELDFKTRDETFSSWDGRSKKCIPKNNFLGVKGDGGFASDGFFLLSCKQHRFCYVEIYQNNFFIFDSTFVTPKQFQTITKGYNNKFNVGHEGKDVFTNISPALPINSIATVLEDSLYILSTLRSQNESVDDFKQFETIDKYNLMDGRYIGSVHIPKVRQRHIQKLLVVDGVMLVFRKNRLSLYFQ